MLPALKGEGVSTTVEERHAGADSHSLATEISQLAVNLSVSSVASAYLKSIMGCLMVINISSSVMEKLRKLYKLRNFLRIN